MRSVPPVPLSCIYSTAKLLFSRNDLQPMPFLSVSGWAQLLPAGSPRGAVTLHRPSGRCGSSRTELPGDGWAAHALPRHPHKEPGVTPGVHGRRLMFRPCEKMSHLDLKRSCLRKKHLTQSYCLVTPKTRAC